MPASASEPREVYTLADLRNWPTATAHARPPLRLAVFGDPVAHSASPPMHNAALAALGLDLRYTRLHIRPAELPEALQLVARQGFVGVNLTIPHKEAAVGCVDAVDELAARLGVINTVRVEPDGTLRGFNTDGPGFARAMQVDWGIELARQRVLLLGAGGGAGRALAVQCALANCLRLVLVNRTAEKAHALAGALRAEYGVDSTAAFWEDSALADALAGCDLVVNTSSLGLRPGDHSPLRAELIPTHARIFDTVYLASGAPTPLETAAHTAGVPCLGGRSLLLHQGALSFAHWFGCLPPLDAMRDALAAPSSPAC